MTTRRYELLPNGLQGGMKQYIENGITPGSFLVAVLTNDLRWACGRADETNRLLLWEIVGWLSNEAPAQCWGSPAMVRAWRGECAK